MPTTTTGVATEFISFTRPSNATVTDSNGVIKWAAHNLLLASEQFDASQWTKNSNPVITANAAVAPNGTTTADKLAGGSGLQSQIVQSISKDASPITYTAGVFVKPSGWNWIQISFYDTVSLGTRFWFDVQNGVKGSSTAIGAGYTNTSFAITAVGNGWYYCTVTATTSSTATNAVYIYPTNADGVQSTGNGTDGILIWGAHLYRSDLGGMQANTSAYPMYNPTTAKNLLGFTESFDNAAWTKTNILAFGSGSVANSVSAPNGLQTADLIVESTATGEHRVGPSPSPSSVINGVYTVSFYAQSAGRVAQIAFGGGEVSGDPRANFDLSNGVLGSVDAAITASITSVGNGWYRCSARVTAASTTLTPVISTVTSTTAARRESYTGNGTSGIYLWGAQLSDSASLDPYSPNHFTAPSAAAYYGPRRDFDPVTLACKGLLVEEQRTNIVLNSGLNGGISGTPGTAPTSWSYFATGTPSVTIATDTETVTGSTLRIVTDATQRLPFGQTVSVAANKTYFLSAVVDVTTSSAVYQHISWSSVPAGATVTYAIDGVVVASTTTIGTGRHIISSILVVSATAGTAAMRLGSGVQLAGAASDITFRQIQVEDGAFRTSYIPTTTTSATRLADVAQVSTAAFPYGDASGSLIVSGSSFGPAGAYKALAVLRNTATATNDRNPDMSLGTGPGGTAGISRVDAVSGGVAQVAIGTYGTFVPGTNYKVGYGYATNDFVTVTDAGTPNTDTSGTVPTGINTMDIGHRNAGSQLNGHIRQITYLPRRLSNAELQTRTA